VTRDLKNIGPSEFTARNTKEQPAEGGAVRRPVTLIAAACALVFVGVVIYSAVHVLPGIGKKIGDSTYFRLEDVDVIGVVRADRDEIGRAIGFGAGSPLLETDLAAIRERVSAVDWVKAVKVSRDLPNKLIIIITEHEPVAVADTDKGRRFVDADGVLAEINADIPGLPRFVGMTTSDQYTEGAGLVELVYEAAIVSEGHVEAVTFDAVMGYSVITSQGIEIRFGQPPFKEKVARLTRVLSDAQKRGSIRSIYADSEDRVVVMVVTPVM